MNITASLLSRYRHFKASHFRWFPEGIALSRLKGICTGKRCFIIGNGPSLSANDLTTLHEHGEITFAFNRIYHIFDQTSWRPTYYISQDQKMLKGCVREVNQIKASIKFFPIEAKWYYGIIPCDATYFHCDNRHADDGKPLFSQDVALRIYNSNTVVYTALQLAAHMGFKEIYLIGVDHHFHTSRDRDGNIVVDPTARDYFTDSYNAQDKQDLYIPELDKSTLTYIAAREHVAKLGIKIYNATRGGKLEVFDRVDFSTLF